MPGPTIQAVGTFRHGIKDNKTKYNAGVEFSTGAFDGTTPLVAEYSIGVGYPSATTRLKLGGEIPVVFYGDHTTHGISIYGEVKAGVDLKKTENTGTARDGYHAYNADLGGGVEYTYRNSCFEASVGGKGGYLHESVIPPVANKQLWNECKAGQAYAGPTARVRFFVPGTQYKEKAMAGFGFGVQVEYDAINKQISGTGTISYSF